MPSSLLKSIGKSLGVAGAKASRASAIRKFGIPLIMGGAVAAGIHASAPAQDPNSPNPPGFFSSLKEGLLDFAMGDPYADVTLAGFPITTADFVPGVPDITRKFEAFNYMRQHGGLQDLMRKSQYVDKERNWYMNQARANVNRGYTTMDNELSSTLPYAPLTQRLGSYGSSGSSSGIQADGSMVFGMYNLRNG